MTEWTLIATILMMANLQSTGMRGPYGEAWRPVGPTETKIERVYKSETACRAALDNLSKAYAPLSASMLRIGDHPYFNWKTGEPGHALDDGLFWLNMAGEPRGRPGTWLSGLARQSFINRWRVTEAEADKIQERIAASANPRAEFDRVYAEMQNRWFREATTKMFGGGQCVQI